MKAVATARGLRGRRRKLREACRVKAVATARGLRGRRTTRGGLGGGGDGGGRRRRGSRWKWRSRLAGPVDRPPATDPLPHTQRHTQHGRSSGAGYPGSRWAVGRSGRRWAKVERGRGGHRSKHNAHTQHGRSSGAGYPGSRWAVGRSGLFRGRSEAHRRVERRQGEPLGVEPTGRITPRATLLVDPLPPCVGDAVVAQPWRRYQLCGRAALTARRRAQS